MKTNLGYLSTLLHLFDLFQLVKLNFKIELWSKIMFVTINILNKRADRTNSNILSKIYKHNYVSFFHITSWFHNTFFQADTWWQVRIVRRIFHYLLESILEFICVVGARSEVCVPPHLFCRYASFALSTGCPKRNFRFDRGTGHNFEQQYDIFVKQMFSWKYFLLKPMTNEDIFLHY